MPPKKKAKKKVVRKAVKKSSPKRKAKTTKAVVRSRSSARAKPPARSNKKARKPVRTANAKAARTEAIISNSPQGEPPRPSIPRKWARHYRILSDLRDTLLEQSGRLVNEVHQEAMGYSMHMADSGTDSFDRDFALSLLSADQNALVEIEAALKRIQTGDYGICEMTGRPISPDRLAAIPWTRFSYEAQDQMEKSGQGGRVQLGTLRSVHGIDEGEAEEPEEGETPKPS